MATIQNETTIVQQQQQQDQQQQQEQQQQHQQPVLPNIQQPNEVNDAAQQAASTASALTEAGQVDQNKQPVPPNFAVPQNSPLIAAQLLQMLPKTGAPTAPNTTAATAAAATAGGGQMDTTLATQNLLNTIGLQQFMQSLQGFQALDPSKLNALNAAALAQFESNRKRKRRKKSAQQIQVLREYFAVNPKPNKAAAHKLANMVQLSYQEVTRWFRNERHKTKKEQAWQRTGAQQVANGTLNPMNAFSGGLPNLDSSATNAAAAAAAAVCAASAVDPNKEMQDVDDDEHSRKKQKMADALPTGSLAKANALRADRKSVV